VICDKPQEQQDSNDLNPAKAGLATTALPACATGFP